MVAAERVDAYWSRLLGVPVAALRDPGVVVVPHAGLGDYRGVWLFARGRSAIVSAPPGWVPRLKQRLGADDVTRDSLLSAIGNAAERVVGPSFQGWLPPDRFRRVASDGVRWLTQAEAGLIQAFRSSCSAEDWAHGGIDPARAEVWSAFEGSRIAALGQMRVHPDGAVDPCVITHAEHRGRGHALRLVSTMSQQALAAGQLILYQTLLSNVPAVSLALRLGFEQYATLIAVGLAADASRG